MSAANKKAQLKIRPVIQRELLKRGWSYRRLSEMTGVPVSTLNQWANGSRPRDLHGLARVAQVFGMTLEELLFGSEKGNKK